MLGWGGWSEAAEIQPFSPARSENPAGEARHPEPVQPGQSRPVSDVWCFHPGW